MNLAYVGDKLLRAVSLGSRLSVWNRQSWYNLTLARYLQDFRRTRAWAADPSRTLVFLRQNFKLSALSLVL